MLRDRLFLIAPAFFLVATLVGFSRSFYLQPYFEFPNLPRHLHIHGVVLTLWFVVACIQPLLVAYNQRNFHRQLGMAGIAIAVGVVLTGIWALVARGVSDLEHNPYRDAGNIASLVQFSLCVGFGMFYRRNREMHKRLMLIASIPILAPALDRASRIPHLKEFIADLLSWFPAPSEIAFAILSFLFLLFVVVLNDIIIERRVHRGTVVGLISIFVLSPAVTFLLVASGLWAQTVNWMI